MISDDDRLATASLHLEQTARVLSEPNGHSRAILLLIRAVGTVIAYLVQQRQEKR